MTRRAHPSVIEAGHTALARAKAAQAIVMWLRAIAAAGRWCPMCTRRALPPPPEPIEPAPLPPAAPIRFMRDVPRAELVAAAATASTQLAAAESLLLHRDNDPAKQERALHHLRLALRLLAPARKSFERAARRAS